MNRFSFISMTYDFDQEIKPLQTWISRRLFHHLRPRFFENGVWVCVRHPGEGSPMDLDYKIKPVDIVRHYKLYVRKHQ